MRKISNGSLTGVKRNNTFTMLVRFQIIINIIDIANYLNNECINEIKMEVSLFTTNKARQLS